MNVLFVLKITGLRGFASRIRRTPSGIRTAAFAEPLVPLGPPIQAVEGEALDRFSYATADSNELYCAAIRLAREMHRSRGIEDTGGRLAELSMSLHHRVIQFGLEHRVPARKMAAALDTVEQSIKASPPSREGREGEDVEFLERALPLVFTFIQPGGDDLARALQDTAPPMSDGLDVVTVSTTDEVVRIHHGNADPYEIALSRIPSPMSLCRWATHLGEKTWINAKTIRTFIATVAGVKGWDLYENPAPQQPAA